MLKIDFMHMYSDCTLCGFVLTMGSEHDTLLSALPRTGMYFAETHANQHVGAMLHKSSLKSMILHLYCAACCTRM